MTKAEIKSLILARIRQNGTKDITGPTLQQVLLEMLDILQTGAGMNYMGNESVQILNTLSPQNGDFYSVTNSGHITKGDFDVIKGEFVIWNSNEQRWYPIVGLVDLQDVQPLITGAATTITEQDLTPGLLLKSDDNGKVSTSEIDEEVISDVASKWEDTLTDLANTKQKAAEVEQTATEARQIALEAQQSATEAINKAESVVDMASEAKSKSSEALNLVATFIETQTEVDDNQDTQINERLRITDYEVDKEAQKNKDDTQDDYISGHEIRLDDLEGVWTETYKHQIDEAISKVHTQNTDTKLVKGVQSVEVTEQSIKLGHHAKDEENLALALGNGTSDNHHNAMSVDWNGNMKVGGSITDGDGNILSKKATLTDLIVDGKVLVYSSANNGLISLTTEELRNLLMWVGTEAELDALPDSEIVEGRIYSTFDGTIKRR